MKNHLKLAERSKDQKIELLAAIKEKKRRRKLRKPPYVPNEGQLRVHQSLFLDRWVMSGNGAGKTTMAIQEAMWAVNGYNPILETYTPVPCRLIVVVDLPAKITDVWIPGLQEWFDIKEDWFKRHGKPYVAEIKFPNGSSIKFMTHDQPELAVESIELDVAIYDEPCPRKMFIGLKRGSRTKKRKARHLFIGTPISAPWIKSDIYDRWVKGELPDTECFRFGTIVNRKNLAEGYIESFSNLLTEKERKVRLEGDFFNMDGFGLAHLFKPDLHICPRQRFKDSWDRNNPCVIAIDPHPEKNHVATIVGVDKAGSIFYLKETSKKLVAREFAEHLVEWCQGFHIIDIVCDSLGSTDGTGNEGFKSFIQVLNEVFRPHKLRVRATTFDEKSDTGLIERFRDLLAIPTLPNNFGQKLPKLRIIEGNAGIVRDIENVSFYKFKDIDTQKDKLDMRQTDYLSCLKYALACGLYYNKGKEKVIHRSQSLYGFKSGKR